MNEQPIHLFVYGTLRPGAAPPEIAHVARTLKFVSDATVRGRLYELGDYPGLILDDSPDAPLIPGDIVVVPDDATLAALDAYEGFHSANPDTSLFRRTQVTASLPDGQQLTCWIYVYNGGVPSSTSMP